MLKFLSAAAICMVATSAVAQEATTKCKTSDLGGRWLVILSDIEQFSDGLDRKLLLEPTRCTIKIKDDGEFSYQACASFRGYDINGDRAIVPFSVKGELSLTSACTLKGNLTIRYSDFGSTETIERSVGGAMAADKSAWQSLVTAIDKLSYGPGVAQAIRIP